jgi:putative endonuclease
MVHSSVERGAAAEEFAAGYLGERGLIVVGRNLRCRAGEIDLVCLDGEVLVMVEVRLRSRTDFGGALESVTPRKRRKLLRAALYHCMHRPGWRARAIRFDVLAVQESPRGRDVAWIRDAFRST